MSPPAVIAPPTTVKSLQKQRITREKHQNAKRRRKEKQDQQRADCDALIRSSPAHFLWNKYEQWAEEKNIKLSNEKWTNDQVCFCTERNDASLIDHVKKIVGDDYIAQGKFKKGSKVKPGVACIALGRSGQRAVSIAPMMYDGKPVGKLFGTHMKIEDQRLWLNRFRSRGLVPSAAGTAKRVQRLIEEGHLTLDHTVALLIDLSRSDKNVNMIDIYAMRDELFDFIHHHACPLIAEGKTRLILFAPDAPQVEEARET